MTSAFCDEIATHILPMIETRRRRVLYEDISIWIFYLVVVALAFALAREPLATLVANDQIEMYSSWVALLAAPVIALAATAATLILVSPWFASVIYNPPLTDELTKKVVSQSYLSKDACNYIRSAYAARKVMCLRDVEVVLAMERGAQTRASRG